MGNKKAFVYFIGVMTIYFLIRYLRTAISLPDFFRFHFTDLLFVPAMALFALIILRFIKKDEKLTIPFWTIFLQVVLVSFYFEFYLPNYQSHVHPYTSDPFDVLMYFVGGGMFVLLQREI